MFKSITIILKIFFPLRVDIGKKMVPIRDLYYIGTLRLIQTDFSLSIDITIHIYIILYFVFVNKKNKKIQI